MRVVKKYDGKLPVVIRAIPEGMVVPVKNAVFTIECNDPECLFLIGWVESLLERLWYPSTIAISSREYKKLIKRYLELSSDSPEDEILFKLHDFGARGCATLEQARIGGAAHLLSFRGTDTFESLRFARHYYDCEMAGFSIPATEHSLTCLHGRANEYDFFKSAINEFLTKSENPEGVPKLGAVVSDTYNIYNAVKFWCQPDIRNLIKESGGTIVIRPDSGDPVEVLIKIFEIFEQELGSIISLNSKGYKMLPNELRIIQGDGIDLAMVGKILHQLVDVMGWSASNIAFGSGGGLLQKFDRDTQKWAYKVCAASVDGVWVNVVKDPITDHGKRSLEGNLDVISDGNTFTTIRLPYGEFEHMNSIMQTVYDCGKILVHDTLDEIRQRIEV